MRKKLVCRAKLCMIDWSVKPVLNVYRFDDELAKQDGIRFKSFPSYNLEWLKYVVDCRRGIDISSDYDVVEGGVANDNVIDTVEDCPSLNMVYSWWVTNLLLTKSSTNYVLSSSGDHACNIIPCYDGLAYFYVEELTEVLRVRGMRLYVYRTHPPLCVNSYIVP